ncbi:MAG: AtpZ/AtpI family protein [Rhizobiales bacterium]|nr:AtpZ/AtpI family protein [Hyphomicrobiales bacterium]
MSEQNRPKKPGGEADASLDTRLEALSSRLAREDRKNQTKAHGKSDNSGFGQGLKIGAEFVSGVLVGAGIGYMIDGWAGTSPFGLIIFLLLGFAAGVLNVLRSVGTVAKPLERPTDPIASRREGHDEEI